MSRAAPPQTSLANRGTPIAAVIGVALQPLHTGSRQILFYLSGSEKEFRWGRTASGVNEAAAMADSGLMAAISEGSPSL